MTEHEIVAGLLSGRLTLREIADIKPVTFESKRLAWCLAIAREFVALGAKPTVDRMVRLFEMLELDTTGLREELEGMLQQETSRNRFSSTT